MNSLLRNLLGAAAGAAALVYSFVFGLFALVLAAVSVFPSVAGAAKVPVQFDVPEGWVSAAAVPKDAELLENRSGPVELESIPAARQQLNGREANVAVVTPQNKPNVVGIFGDTHGSGQELQRDVWLKVTGGAFRTVCGGAALHWQNNHATFPRGTLFTEIASDATADLVIGALWQGGYTGDAANHQPNFRGNALVVVNGKVTGNVVGGATSDHNHEPHLEGNTAVIVRSLQSAASSRILGGSCYSANSASGARHYGNTSVTVDLQQSPAGTFGREIVGGSYGRSSGNWVIDGNTSVTVNAPTSVVFSRPIYGGSVSDGQSAGLTDISGNASVTLNGGAYSGQICAGGYGAGCRVQGVARLTVGGGAVFRAGSSLLPSKNGSTAGSSELVLGGGASLAAADAVGPFGKLTLNGNVTLGAHRFPDVPLAAVTAPSCITLTLSDDEKRNRDVLLFASCKGDLPDTLTLSVTNADAGDTWKLLKGADGTVRVGAPHLRTWTSASADAEWSEGFAGFVPGDSVDFGSGAPLRVRIEDSVRCTDIRIDRDVTLFVDDAAVGLQVASVTVGPNGRLAVTGKTVDSKVRARYVRFDLLRRPSTGQNADGVALSELALVCDGKRLPGSVIASVSGNPAGTGLDHLKDGNLGVEYKWFIGNPSATLSDYYILLDAGVGRNFVCDGYQFGISDREARTPSEWRVTVSSDGTHWLPADSRDIPDEQIVNKWTRGSWLEPAFRFTGGFAKPVQIGSIHLAGTLASSGSFGGTLVCADTARLELPLGEPLRFDGTATGTLQLTLADGDAVTEPRRVLVTSEQPMLNVLPPVGTDCVVWYEDGAYWVKVDVDPPFRATVAGNRRLSDLTWTDARGRAVSYKVWSTLGKSQRRAELILGAGASVLTLDETLPELRSLSVSGEASSALEVVGGPVSADLLAVLRASLRLPAASLSAGQASLQGCLELTSEAGSTQTLPMFLTGDGTFRKSGDGTVVLTPQPANEEGCLIDGVTVELAGGLLRLAGSGTVPVPQIARSVFRFADADGDTHADGRLESAARVTSSTMTEFSVPEGVTDASAAVKLSGTGVVRKTGAGLLTLSLSGAEGGTAPYSGETLLDAGTLRIRALSALTLGGAVSGQGALEFTGEPVTVTAYNTYKGVTRLRDGVSVYLSGDASLGAGAVYLSDGSLLAADTAEDIVLSDVVALSGTAVLSKTGTGSLTAASVSGGTVELAGGTLGIGPLSADSPVLTKLDDGLLVMAFAEGGNAVRTLKTTLEKAPGGQHFRVVRTAGGAPEMPRRAELKNGVLSFVFAEDGNVWNNRVGNGRWSTPGNWSLGTVPVPGEEVVLTAGVGTLEIDADNVTVSSLTVIGGYRDTLVIKGKPLTVTDSVQANASFETDASVLRLRESDGASPAFSARVFVSDGVSVTVNVASGTWPVSDLSGKGRFAKTGAGTLALVASGKLTGGTVRGTLTLDIVEGGLDILAPDGTDPVLSDMTLAFGAKTGHVRASRWLNIAGTVTVDSGSFVELESVGPDPVSLHGTGMLVKRGAGTFAWTERDCVCHGDLAVSVDEGSVGLIGDNADFGGSVSGSGRIQIVRGSVRLSGENTHTGGTEILAGATLNATAAGDALGTGPLMGTGTLSLPHSTLPEADLRKRLQQADWKGTLLLDYDASGSVYNLDLSQFGNRGSSVAVAGTLRGFFSNADSMLGALDLRGTLWIDNGFSSRVYNLTGGLFGAGLLKTEGKQNTNILISGPADRYEGSFDILGSHSVIFGTSVEHRSPGWIVVDSGYSVRIAPNRSWTATWVYPGSSVGGTGTVLDKLVFEDGAFIDAAPDGWLKHARRWNAGQCTVRGGLTIRFPEGTKLPALNEPGRKVLESEVPIVLPEQFAPTVTVGSETVAAAVKVSPDGRSLSVHAVSLYETSVAGGRFLWSDLEWKLNGTGPAKKFADIADRRDAAFRISAAEDAMLQAYEKIECHALMTAGEGRVTLNFSESMMTRDNYGTISALAPFELPLFSAINDPAAFDVSMDALRYGAKAFISRDGAGAKAVVSRETGEARADFVSINFTATNNELPDDREEGFMPLAGRHWTQVVASSNEDGVNPLYYSAATDTSAPSTVKVKWQASATWDFVTSMSAINYSYLDEFVAPIVIEVSGIPDDWVARGYSVVIYCSTEDVGKAFTAKTIGTGPGYASETSYTFDDTLGVTTVGNTSWGEALYNQEHSDFVEGRNILIVRDMKAPAFRLTSRGGWMDDRGCISALQLLCAADGSSELPPDYTAETSGTVRWNDLKWKADGAAVGKLPEDASVYLNLTGDTVLDLEGAAPVASVTVNGQGYRLTIRNAGTFSPVWSFSSGLTLVLSDPALDSVPEQVVVWPGRILYTYAYRSGPEGFTAVESSVTEFAAGFEGPLHAAAGTRTVFSGGTVKPTVYAADRGTVVFAGTANVTDIATERGDVLDGLGIGNGTYVIGGHARVTVNALVLSDGGVDRSASLELKDDAVLTVTGSQNGNHNRASFMFGHWHGPSRLTVRGRARLLAEQAVMLVGYTGDVQTFRMEGGEVRVKGIAVASAAAGTNSFDLAGGRFLVGSEGLKANAQYRMNLKMGRRASLGAFEDCRLSGADVISSLTLPDGVVTLGGGEGELLLSDSYFFADAFTNLVIRANGAPVTVQDVNGRIRSLRIEENAAFRVVRTRLGTDTLILGGTLFMDARAVLNASTFRPEGKTALLSVACGSTMAECGYLSASEGVPADLGSLFVEMVLNARRENEIFPPMVPVIVGPTFGGKPKLRSVSVRNDSTAMNPPEAVYDPSGLLGDGLYLKLSGDGVSKAYNVTLSNRGDHRVRQSTADTYTYQSFSATQPGGRMVIPDGGILLEQAAFRAGTRGATIGIRAEGTRPFTLMQGTAYTVSVPMEFDLTAWDLSDFVRGAVKGVPVTHCLMSGAFTWSVDASRLTVKLTRGQLPDGFTAKIAITAGGIYLSVEADRTARSVSVNLSSGTHLLPDSEARFGFWSVPRLDWNQLCDVWISDRLIMAGRGGTPVAAVAANGLPTQIDFQGGVPAVNAAAAAEGLTRVFASDRTARTFALRNLPFDRYRVILTFASDYSGAAYAPIEIAGKTYTMDGAYTRCGILGNGGTIPADRAWGQTRPAEVAAKVGSNTLVTDVLTGADAVTVSMPALDYGETYAGLAAIQVVEAPELTVQPLPRSYTLLLEPADAGTEIRLAERLPDWVSATNASLTVSASSQFEGDVTLRLPAHFEADNLTFGRMLSRTSLTLVSEDGDTFLGSVDASGLKNLTMGIPCIATDFEPAARVTRFEKMFDNNGRPYTIGADATLVLSANAGITTSMDVHPGFLNISPNSTGVLRREYGTEPGITNFPNVTFSWQSYVYDNDDADNTSSNILVEDGDVLHHGARYHLFRESSATPWTYTQTGGEAYFVHPSATEGGMLLFNSGSAAGGTANVSVSGGLLETTGIWAWQSGTKVNVSLSGDARLRLGPTGFSVNRSGGSVRGTLSDRAVIETTAPVTDAKNPATVSLALAGGTLRALSGNTDFRIPLVFAAPADKPAVIELPVGGRMTLGAASSSGTGAVRIASGTVAVRAAQALGSADVTVAPGAALECIGVGRTAGSVTFEAGSSLVASNSGSDTVILGSRPPVLPADRSGMIFILNGRYYAPDQVTVSGNGLRFGTAAPADTALAWDPAAKTGTWRNGLDGAWWKDGKRYTDGASVTFSGTRATVTVMGRVAPASVSLNDTDGFAFVPNGADAAGEIDITAMGAKALNLGTDTVFDVPLITAAPAKDLTVSGDGNSYRLLGSRRGDRVTLFLNSGALNDAQQPTWLPDTVNAVTFAPHPGEIQELPPGNRAMLGTGTVTLAGGGSVVFPGTVNGTNWNASFRGNFIVTDGTEATFTMTRAVHSDGGDANPYFRDDSSQALWRRISSSGADVPGFRLRNGAVLDIAGCRGLIGSFSDQDDPRMVNNHPVFIGRNATMRYSVASHDGLMNFVPYGHRFNGDGAVLDFRTRTYLRYGTDMDVAGIGDRGDPTEPTLGPDGLLTQGIRARIEGAVAVAYPEKGDTLRLRVGEGSDLEFNAGILRAMKFEKNGPGSLTLTRSEFPDPVTLHVREGSLFGSSRMTAFGSEVVLENGTSIGPGMNLAMLRFNGSDCTIYADVSGNRTLCAETVAFDGGNASSYRIRPFGDGPIPPARGRAPIRILSWSNALGIDSATFSLDETVRAAGYALDVSEDGLYLKESQRWYRDLTDRVPEMQDRQWYVLEWNMHDAWACTDLKVPAKDSGDPTPGEQLAAAPRSDYLPDSSRATEAIFVVPSAARLPRVPSFRIKLDRETHFSSVRFVREDTLETVTQVSVSYIYVLTHAPLPGPEGTKAYTWVSYLAVEGSVPATVGEPEGVPAGYDTAVRDRTVLLYREASKPSVNISFTDGTEGTSSFISATDAPIGAEPFAGVYWSNVSTELSQVGGTQDGFRLYRTTVRVNGATRSDDGTRTDVLSLDYITRGPVADPTRHSGGERLAAVWLPGSADRVIPDQLLAAGSMSKSFMRSGWHLKLSAVPFRSYDLYLLMAGRTGARRYSAVRVKTGDSSWKTYTFTDDWAAPVAPAGMQPWPGVGVGPAGSFDSGRNLLHLRIQTETGADLQICSADARDDGGAVNGDAANQGLAGLQIVSCDGAVYEKFGSNGAWSDATGWKLAKNDGSFLLTSWKNPTPEAPYSADIPVSGGSVKVDRFVSVPSVRFFGEGRSFTLDGTEPMLQAVTLDFSDVAVNSSVSIPRDIFLNSPQFLLAPGMRISVPESSTVPMVNDWNWGYATDSNGTGAAASVLLHKKFPGDLSITSPMIHGAMIDAGTLWIDSPSSQTNIGAFSGAGTLGKRGSGTLILTGPFRSSSANPLHVSGGTLVMNTHLDQLQSAGPRMTVDGGTVELRIDQARPAGAAPVWDVSNGGVLKVRGDCNVNRMHLRLSGNGKVTRVQEGHAGQWAGYQFQTIEVSGSGNVIDNRAGGWGGPGMGALAGFRLMPNAELTVTGSVGAQRITDGIIQLDEGSEMTSYIAVGRGNSSSYGDTSGNANNSVLNYPMRMIGSGRWRVRHFLGPRDSNWGISLTVEGGEISFELPNGIYNPSVNNAPLTIRAGATLSGFVSFNDCPTVTLDSGSVLRNGVRESPASGGLTLQGGKTEFAASPSGDTVHNMIFDLRNGAPLTFSGHGPSVHGNGILRITLEHPEYFRGARRLIKWPQGEAPNAWKKIDNIVSSQVVALDAKFEIRNTANDAGLWLVPADALYLSKNVSGKWSQNTTWEFKDTPTAFPPYEEVPTAKVIAASADVRLTADDTEPGATEVLPWKMGALVLNADGRDISLVRDTDADGKPAGAPLALSSALWKQGSGTAAVNVPTIFGGHAGGVSVTVDRGTLRFDEPVQQMTRTAYDDLTAKVKASAEIGAGAVLRYTAVTDALREGRQIFTGTLTGSGIFELEQPAPEEGMPERKTDVEIGGAAESTAGLRVLRGTLRLSGERRSVSMPAGRRFDVAADGAQLVLASEWGYGGGRDTVLSLLPSAAEGHAPLMVTAGSEIARIRGTVSLARPEGTPEDARSAAIGGDAMNFDDDITFSIAEGNTLTVTAGIGSVEDREAHPTLTKTGRGTLSIAGNYESDADITVAAGTLRFGSSNISEMPASGASGSLTVNKDAFLRLADGLNVFDPTDGARLTMRSGSTLLLSVDGSEVVGSDVVLEDGVTLKLEAAATSFPNALLTLGERSSLRRDGVIVVDLDVFDIAAIPETLDRLPVISLAADSPVFGAGTFVLGGKKQADWAKAGWSLEVTRTSVAMVYFGGSSAYTWAGGKENGNWMSGNWSTDDAKDTDGNPVATVWPDDDGLTPDEQYSVKLTDMSPLDGGVYIPAANRTIADDPAKGIRRIRALWANISDDALSQEPGDYTFTAARPDQDLYINGEILKSGTADLNFLRPVRTESEAGALRIFGGTVDFGSSLTSLGRSRNYGLPITFGGGSVLRFSGAGEQTLSGIIDAGEGSGAIERTGRGRLNLDTPVDMLTGLSVTGASMALRQRNLYGLDIPVTLKTAADGSEASLEIASVYTGAGAVRMKVNADAAAPDGVLGWQADFGGISADQMRLGRPEGLAEDRIAYNVKALRYAPQAGHLVLSPVPGILPETAELRLAGGTADATALWLGAQNVPGNAPLVVGSLTGTGRIGVEPVTDGSSAPWRDTRVLTVALEPGSDTTFGGSFAGAVTDDGHAITAGLSLVNRDPSADMAIFRYQGISDGTRLGTLAVGSGINAEVSGTWAGSVRLASGALLSGSGTFGSGNTQFGLTDGATLTASALGSREIENGVIVREVIPTEMNIRGTLKVTADATLKVLVRTDKATKAPWVSCVNVDNLVVPSAIADGDAMHFNIVIDVEKGVLGASTKILGWKRHSGLRIGIRPEDITIVRADGDTDTYDFRVEQRGDGLYLVRAKSRFWMIVR